MFELPTCFSGNGTPVFVLTLHMLDHSSSRNIPKPVLVSFTLISVICFVPLDLNEFLSCDWHLPHSCHVKYKNKT